MNKGLIYILGFVCGAGVGAVSTMRYFKNKYETIANDEIASVKEVYVVKKKEDLTKCNDEKNESEIKNKDIPVPTMEEKREYHKITNTYKVDTVEPEEHLAEIANFDSPDRPFIISPEEFGAIDDYETESLVYYEDGILADDDDLEISDVDGLVGLNSLEKMGMYHPNIIHVRNHDFKTDFEITQDFRRFYGDVVDDKDEY